MGNLRERPKLDEVQLNVVKNPYQFLTCFFATGSLKDDFKMLAFEGDQFAEQTR